MKSAKDDDPLKGFALKEQLVSECRAMAQHAFANGLKVPGEIVKVLQAIAAQGVGEDPAKLQNAPDGAVAQLAAIHAQLAEIVAPAKPRSILLLITEGAKGKFWQFLGPVPLVRRMMAIAIFSLIALIGISLAPDVDGNPERFNLFSQYKGASLLLNQLFLLSAAAIGASFAALFLANEYIQDGTFDPVYESSYWARFVLGLLAGMMLGSLVPIESYIGTASDAAPAKGAPQGFGRPILALLGGFSADLLFRILNRLIDAVDALVRGDTADIVAAQEQAAKARLAEQSTQNRLQLATMLTKLQQQLGPSVTPEDIKQELNRLQSELIAPGSYSIRDGGGTEGPAPQRAETVAGKSPSGSQST